MLFLKRRQQLIRLNLLTFLRNDNANNEKEIMGTDINKWWGKNVRR